jgi:hypothetical protein
MKHLVVALLFVVACSKSKDAPATGSGSGGTTGSAEPVAKGSDTGSAMAGSGSGATTMAGSGSAAMAGSGGGSAAAGSGAGSDKFDFDKLTHEEKMDFMKQKILPAMKKEFQTFDAKKYAKFDCKTCHGKDPKGSKYKMPNPELPKLDFVALKAGKQAPKVAEFMGKVVKPKMAELLQQSEMTESNPTGFGCLECHIAKK